MENFIIVVALLLIMGGAGMYVYKAKKRGVKCIGCPAGGKCSGKNGDCLGCSCDGNCNCHENSN